MLDVVSWNAWCRIKETPNALIIFYSINSGSPRISQLTQFSFQNSVTWMSFIQISSNSCLGVYRQARQINLHTTCLTASQDSLTLHGMDTYIEQLEFKLLKSTVVRTLLHFHMSHVSPFQKSTGDLQTDTHVGMINVDTRWVCKIYK